MKFNLAIAATASLAVFAIFAASYGPSSAASRTACDVLTASQASAIVGSPVTTQGHPSPISAGSSVCMYLSGGRPIVQLGLTVAANEAVAAQVLKQQQQAAARHKNVGNRQKGNIILSGITMSGDTQQLNRLLDAASKNL
ncbi:MAG: hypothetical protein M3N49_04830 [Candidatus Eremiobacteraeota bacterium]|nr:hypothetical protein [Candidatus Eremiobacteraeota bacterium]